MEESKDVYDFLKEIDQGKHKADYIQQLARLTGVDNLPDDLRGEVSWRAYEQGHSSGDHSIAAAYIEFADFAVKCFEAGFAEGHQKGYDLCSDDDNIYPFVHAKE